MHIALLFPPVTDPRAPHLAVPSLAAHLRAAGVRTTVRDLNLEGFFHLIRPDRLTASLAVAGDRMPGHLREVAGAVVERVEGALATLRDPHLFFDPDEHHAARSTLLAACEIVSAARPSVDYSISSARYDVEGIDASRLQDLLTVSADPAVNLFEDHWNDEVLPSLDRDRPDLVGVSILNRQQIIPGLTLARRLREHGHVVAIGGTVYAKFVEQLRRRPEFFSTFCDVLVPYEGEPAFDGLIQRLELGSADFGGVPNTMVVGDDGQVQCGPVLVVEDVDSLPTPDFDGLPLAEYLAPHPVLPILTGKGCYFNRCKFCDIPYINHPAEKPYRARSEERIAADVATLWERFGARHFVITDETVAPHRFRRLADVMEDHPGVDPRFVGYARLEPGFTPETCERIYELGVRKLFFGLESGSQAVLDHMDKGITVEFAGRVLRNCVGAGIGVHLFSIVGFPEETEDQARETLSFFLDQRDTLSHPRNTFDVHRFGLDLRTDYFDRAGDVGVTIDHRRLTGRDFPISVDAWENTRGLDGDEVGTLLDEFTATIREHYRGDRNFPDQQWPGFEEYAVLYGDHFEDRFFGHRLSLPSAGDPRRFALIWAADVTFMDRPGDTEHHRVRTIAAEETLTGAALALLAQPGRPGTVDELLARFGGRVDHRPEEAAQVVSEIRALIDRLLAARVLWLRPEAPREQRAARVDSRVHLRDQITVRVSFDDRTPFGSPVGPAPDENTRRLFAPLVEALKETGPTGLATTIPALLDEVITSTEFAEVAEVSSDRDGWEIRDHVLHPDPTLASPVSFTVSDTDSEQVVEVAVGDSLWPAAHRALAALAGPGLAIDAVEDGRVADLAARLGAAGFTATAAPADPLPEGITFVGHNTVLVDTGSTRVLVDPMLMPNDARYGDYQPLALRELPPVDAVLITHSHPDHFDPGSLLRVPVDTPVIVPRVERETVLSVDMVRRLEQLGHRSTVALDWGATLRVGDAEIHAVPFRGEQPTSGSVLHSDVRNAGNAYVVGGPDCRVAFLADTGSDAGGSSQIEATKQRRRLGPVDVVFAGYRGWRTYPSQLLLSSVARYALFTPRAEWFCRQQLMNDAEDVIDVAERWGARYLVPCAAGGAPWYWDVGLGPRLDGTGPEDEAFDPRPERVIAAAARRLTAPGGEAVPTGVQVLLLRPGDTLVGAGDAEATVRRAPGHSWPFDTA